MTSFSRLVFGMHVDEQLPFSPRYRVCVRKLRTPVGACIVVGGLAGIFLVQYKSAGIVAVAATATTSTRTSWTN